MSDTDPAYEPLVPARGDAPALRHCLRCKVEFQSEGFGERICRRCKGQVAWKSAIPAGDGSSRRGSSR